MFWGNVFLFILAMIVCAVVHEGAHWIAAKIFGKSINYRIEKWKLFDEIPIYRGIWDMPDMDLWKQQIVGSAGFGVELLFNIPLYFIWTKFFWFYLFISVSHVYRYNMYSGEANDFNVFRNSSKV